MLSLAEYTGTMRDPERVNGVLDGAWHSLHLVSPAMTCPRLTEGWAILFSAVYVNIERETYLISGADEDGRRADRNNPRPDDRLGLSRSALDRIAMAVGVSWDPGQTVRLDDGRDPHYCACRAVGLYKLFDGEVVTCQGDKEIDLREGSDYVEQIRWQAANRKPKPGNPDIRLRNERLHIQSFCMTKARNRAIRTLGVRTWYYRDELEGRPFIVAKPMFTGETDNPELARIFAVQLAARNMQSASALYAGVQLPTLAPGVLGAPPVNDTRSDEPGLWELACEYCGDTEKDGRRVTARSTRQGEVIFCDKPTCTDCAWKDTVRAENAWLEKRAERAASLPKTTVRADSAPQQSPPRGPDPWAKETAANRAPNAGSGTRPVGRSSPGRSASVTGGERPATATPATGSNPPPGAPRGAPPPAVSSPPTAGRPAPLRKTTGLTLPCGLRKGQPIEESTDADLHEAITWLDRRLTTPGVTKEQYRAQDQRLLDAMLAEYDSRVTAPKRAEACGKGKDDIPY